MVDRDSVLGAVEAVAGVATAGEDVADGVELAVDDREEKRNVGVVLCESSDSLGSPEDADEHDVLRARVLELLDRQRRTASRGEHGVEDEADAVVRVDAGIDHAGHLGTMELGLEGVRVPAHGDVPHIRLGQERVEGIHHAGARAHDGNERNPRLEVRALDRLQRRVHRFGFHGDVFAGPHGQEQAQPVQCVAELGRAHALVAQGRQQNGRESFFQNMNRHGFSLARPRSGYVLKRVLSKHPVLGC